MERKARQNESWKGDFHLWILGTNGERGSMDSFANNKGHQLRKLKNELLQWRKFTVERAHFYDKRIPDAQGQATEIGRYQDGKFIGV